MISEVEAMQLFYLLLFLAIPIPTSSLLFPTFSVTDGCANPAAGGAAAPMAPMGSTDFVPAPMIDLTSPDLLFSPGAKKTSKSSESTEVMTGCGMPAPPMASCCGRCPPPPPACGCMCGRGKRKKRAVNTWGARKVNCNSEKLRSVLEQAMNETSPSHSHEISFDFGKLPIDKFVFLCQKRKVHKIDDELNFSTDAEKTCEILDESTYCIVIQH